MGGKELNEILEQAKEDRTLEEIVSDHLLLMYIIKKHSEISRRYLGITKLQKYAFLSENSMNKNKIKGLNYNFFRYDYGPISKQLYKDIELFRRLGIVYKDRIKLTEKGERVFEILKNTYQKNKQVIQIIDEQIQKLANMDTEQVKQYVYNLEKTFGFIKMKIKEIPMFFDILSKLPKDKAKIRFEIDEETIETLNILLDDETSNNILQTIKSKGKSVPYEGLVEL